MVLVLNQVSQKYGVHQTFLYSLLSIQYSLLTTQSAHVSGGQVAPQQEVLRHRPDLLAQGHSDSCLLPDVGSLRREFSQDQH